MQELIQRKCNKKYARTHSKAWVIKNGFSIWCLSSRKCSNYTSYMYINLYYNNIIHYHLFLGLLLCAFQFLSKSSTSTSSFSGGSSTTDSAWLLSHMREFIFLYWWRASLYEGESPTKTKNIKFIWPIYKYHWSSLVILKKTSVM